MNLKMGKLILNYRQSHGMTQRDLSTKLGLSSPQFISNIEREVVLMPIKMAAQISKIFKLDKTIVWELVKADAEEWLKRDWEKCWKRKKSENVTSI